jgi:hypothetical protein
MLVALFTLHSPLQLFNGPMVLLLAVLYAVPALVGLFSGRRHGLLRIVLVNLFLGWTIIGWVLAFAWSIGGTNAAYEEETRGE